MKRKIFLGIGIVIFMLLLNFTYFVVTAGSLTDDPPSLGEKISLAFAHPLWLSPFYTIVISVSNPLFTLFLIALCVAFYYLYDNFIKNKKEAASVVLEEQIEATESKNELYNGDSKIEFFDDKTLQAKTRDRLFKKIVLFATPVIILYVLFVSFISSGPGEGMVGLVFLLPIMPVIYIFYPVYFIILSVRYSKEKSGMDSLDKIMFYVLLVPFIILAVFVVYRIYSGNLIQEVFNQRNTNVEKKIEKQTGPSDLVIKDIYHGSDSISIKFCNESTNATVKKVAIKLETDKGFSNIIENYPSLQVGECENAQIFIHYLKLQEGDFAKITATLNPNNKILEINSENNKMTKDIDFSMNSNAKPVVSSVEPGKCLDTDGGKNYYEKGSTSISGKSDGRIDCCKKSPSDGACSPQGQYVIESYCENENQLSEPYECSKGCTDGVCIK